MQFNNSLFQSGLGLLAGSMPNSGFSPWAAGLQGAQSGMAQDRADADRKRWEALIAGQGQPPGGATPNPAALAASVPPINQAGGPMPSMGGVGVPSSAGLRQQFGMAPAGLMAPSGGQPSFSGAAAPSAQPSVASTSRGQGLGSEYWREFGLRKPQNAPAGAPPALTAARGGPAGVQVAALGPMGSGGAAMGTGGGQVTLAPQGQPQQALGVSPGPGTGLQGLLASMDPQTRQMVAMLGPERGTPLLMSMLAERNKPGAITETQERQNLAAAAGLRPGTPEHSDFMLRGTAAPAPKAPTAGTLEKNLITAGFTPGTPEYEAAARRQMAKPNSVVNVNNAALGGVALTPGQKAVDTKYAPDYAEFVLGGGFADAEKGVEQLKGVVADLEAGEPLTGTLSARVLPESVRAVTDPASLDAQQLVEEVVQRNLRLVLGAQFTEGEGMRLIARAYNPALSPENNAKRLRRLFKAMEKGLQARTEAAQYYEENGTLRGYQGTKLVSPGDLNRALDAGGGSPTQTATEGPATVTSDEEYNALPSGTEFIDPEGVTRRKP